MAPAIYVVSVFTLQTKLINEGGIIMGKEVWSWREIVFQSIADLQSEELSNSYITITGDSVENMTGTKFNLFWIQDGFLRIQMNNENENLIESFSKAFGQKPFCKYTDHAGNIIFEWNKFDSARRFAELEKEEKINLEKLS